MSRDRDSSRDMDFPSKAELFALHLKVHEGPVSSVTLNSALRAAGESFGIRHSLPRPHEALRRDLDASLILGEASVAACADITHRRSGRRLADRALGCS